MANKGKQRGDQWFKEVSGNGYTGPLPGSGPDASRNNANPSKRPGTNLNARAGKSNKKLPSIPNSIPADFAGRGAKVSGAKPKAMERNWKRKKDEPRCRICGEWGHFSQGCPSTLGVNKKQEVVEIIHLKEKYLKSKLIGTGGSVIQGIEKDTGCHLHLEDDPTVGNETFLVRICGPNRFIVSKAVNVVKDLVDKLRDEWNQQSGKRSYTPYHGSSNVPMTAAQMQHTTSENLQQKSNLYGPKALHPDDGQILSHREARQQWEAASFQEPNGRAAPGPSRVANLMNPDREGGLYHGWNQNESYPNHKANFLTSQEQQIFPRIPEELDQLFVDENMEISKQKAAEEDREMDRHREQMRIIHEHFQQKGVQLRTKHAEQLTKFLHRQGNPSQQYPHQPTRDRSANNGESQVPGRNRGNIHYEQYDANSVKNVQGHEAEFESFHESAPHNQNPPNAYQRKHDYETKPSRSMQGGDYDAYARSSLAHRSYQ